MSVEGSKVKAPSFGGKQFYDREITLMRWNVRRNKSARHGDTFLSSNFIVDLTIYEEHGNFNKEANNLHNLAVKRD